MTCNCKPGVRGEVKRLAIRKSDGKICITYRPCPDHPEGLAVSCEQTLKDMLAEREAEIERLRRDLRDLQKKYDDMRLNYEKAHNRANEATRLLREGGDDEGN